MLGKPDACRVIPGLWLGAAPTRRDAKRLLRQGITAVVDLRAEAMPGDHWPNAVRVEHIPLIDHAPPSLSALRSAAAKVRELVLGGNEVLVHCRAGRERGPVVVAATLVEMGWPLREAYQQVLRVRPDAHPNEGQLAALAEMATYTPPP